MTRTLRQSGLPSILTILLAILLATQASAFTIKLGPVREQTIRWLMESRGVSRDSAQQMIREAAREHRAEIIDSVTIPDGTIADFVSIDATGPGKPKIEHQGCAMLFSPSSEYGRKFWAAVEKTRGTPAYDNFLRAFGDAVQRGYFIQKLTPEQEARLQGKGRDTPAAAYQYRVLIAAPKMPYWDDIAPGAATPHVHSVGGSIPPTSISGHPLNLNIAAHALNPNPYRAECGLSIGGAWNAGNPTGLTNPTWNNSGQFTALPNGHPEIRRYYNTNTQLVDHWFTLIFDTTNPNSLANWWRANSHGKLDITGDRTNVAGWLETMHPLDATDVGEIGGHDYLPMPGTPVIRASSIINPGGNPIIRASLNGTQFSVLYNPHGGTGVAGGTGSYTFTFSGWPLPAAGPLFNYNYWIKPGTGTKVIDPYDDRHVTFTGVTWQYADPNKTPPDDITDASGGPPAGTAWSMVTPVGTWDNTTTGYMPIGQGCGALAQTLVTGADIVPTTDAGHRLESICYYTHDHLFTDGSDGGRPYQLRHPLTNGSPDDIMGATDAVSEHFDRPAVYDHNSYDDANYKTAGLFHYTNAKNTGAHSTTGWMSDVNATLGDAGFVSSNYNATFYIWPDGDNALTGADIFIPMAQLGSGRLTVPETAGLGLLAHESGHALASLPDLYDTDFYWNAYRQTPPHLETDALGPYSIMANGGMRIDAFCKMIAQWPTGIGFLDPVLLGTMSPRAPKDKVSASIPEVEGSLQSPIVYKALPDLWANPTITGDQEYFLIENRNRNGGSYFGDPSPRGMYIYHIDRRFGQDDDAHFRVVIEQADGLNQLETQPRGWNVGQPDAMAGDPFPGSYDIRSFTNLGTIDGSGAKKASPTTRSHGVVVGGSLVPTTGYDTFFRADRISGPGATMTADLWVQPHELIVTAKPTAVDFPPPAAYQGEKNVPVLGLHLKNSNVAPDISTGDVVIREILIDESGSSKNDLDTDRALVYEDVNSDGVVTPGTDVLLATGTVQDQQANITGLSYRVPANQSPPAERDLLICYDIAESAQPGKTIAAGIDYADPNINPSFPRSALTCQIPGAIQERVRTGLAPPNNLGADRFPIRTDPSDRTLILEAPDILTIDPDSKAPESVLQGTLDVEMLSLGLSVDQDAVIIDGLRVDRGGTSTRTGDVLAKLYDDLNLNEEIDPGEPVIDTATFFVNGSNISAEFDDLGDYTVVAGTNRALIIAYDFAVDATGGDTVTARLANPTFVTLRDPEDVVATDNFPMESDETEIRPNLPPTLAAQDGGTVNWLTPTQGTPITQFTWYAIYTDGENDPPSFIRVVIDNVAYNMQPVNPVDTNYTDGAAFRLRRRLPVGDHNYFLRASDGTTTVRYPTTAPAVYPYPEVDNNPPLLSNASVTPPRGDLTVAFLYQITFTDIDGHLASYVNVSIDGGAPLPMVEDDPADTDTTDGKLYTLTMPAGSFIPGAHKAKFTANDGFDTVQYPSPGEMTGPIVNSDSTGFWANDSYNPFLGPYEEGDHVFMVITDIDQNANVGVRDTLNVTVTVVTGGDTETIALLETTVDSGIFRSAPGGVPTLGRAGISGDGVINVIAGPAGNQLRLRYVDPFDGTDTQTLLIGVIDTEAPRRVYLGELSAAKNGDGTQVDVNWTPYDEAGQIDVARYRVYFESAPADINTLTPAATVLAGTRTVTLPTGGPDGDRYVAVAVHDEVPNFEDDVKWRQVGTADTNPPTLLGEDPADGSTEVPLDTDIGFRLDDAGRGVDVDSIRVRIRQEPEDGGAWTNVTSSLQITGPPSQVSVTYAPPEDFEWNQQVFVEVRAEDEAGNVLLQTFSFWTLTDVNAPQLQNLIPAAGATNVPVDTNIQFELTDDRSGVDPSSIHVTVNGTDVSNDVAQDVTQALQIGGTPLLTTVVYDPPEDFDWGETVTVTVDASDEAHNAMSTVLYSFTILPDTAGVVIDQLAPANGATDVPRDTSISFRVSDSTSGVDTSSVELYIDGVRIPLTAANFRQLSPTAYLVTYIPPTSFPYSTRVEVRASAQDLAENPRVTVTWHFDTEPPPTYSITGTIRLAGTGAGVAGVRVQILDAHTRDVVQTAISVGTGVFEATGLLDGTYVVEPKLTDYTFVSRKSGKPTQSVYVGMRDTDGDGNPQLDASGVDFDAMVTLYAIKGTVLEGGVPLQGVQLTDGTRTALTDANGEYSIADVPSGTYTVTPSKTNYTFNPASRAAVVASANAEDIDFTATARTFSVSGKVQDSAGNRLAGVKMEVEGGTSVAVTNAAGEYTLTGIKAGTRTILASRDGYVFEPAVGVTSVNVPVDRNLTGIDFIGYPLMSRTFAAGVRFVGVPTTPRDSDAQTVFGTPDIARWVGTASPPRYVTVRSDPGHAYLRVRPGAGFFVRYAQDTTLDVAGQPVSTTQPFTFVVDEGWYMAANPFPTALGFRNLSPSAPNAMAPYGFVLEGREYAIVSDVADLGGRRWIDGWEGVWLLSDVSSLSVTAMPPGSGTASADLDTVKRVVDRSNWRIPIVATAAGTRDACSVVGVSARAGALAVVNPPPLDDTVDVIVHGANDQALACDLKAKAGSSLVWRFSVVAPRPEVDVQVSLPDLTEVPQDLTVTLVDETAGKTMYARTLPSYVYNSGQGGVHEFRLEVKSRTAAGLTLRPAGAQVRANVAAISYVVSTEAEISARVLTVAGRPVRALAGGTTAAGTNTLNWDLLGDARTRVPAGRYLVEIQAVTPDGARATTIQSILVDR